MSNNATKTAIIIPARYGSTRLEGKPLLEVDNKPIIQWVVETAKCVDGVDYVIVATDDERIFDACKKFGADVEMTSTEHKSGTDRIAEVVDRHSDIKYIVNLQGDEPMMPKDAIQLVIDSLKNNNNADISTLIRPENNEEELNNPNLVKCVISNDNFALYFSRSKIPFERNPITGDFYAHLGIYGYTREALFKMRELPQSSLERTESLEQLRALQNGLKIITNVVNIKPIGIDTIEDFERFKAAKLLTNSI
ncbi:3-deoxy-manno-octulosonate cytidylyltransferase [bacterium]|nr:3-deoxy-manno-octulosonate cytidylyltransferase [bacterium]